MSGYVAGISPTNAELILNQFDAPIGYVSITAAYTDQWEKWWKNPDNVDLYQFMGKDSESVLTSASSIVNLSSQDVYFHTVLFPAMLLGDGGNWTMLHNISSTRKLCCSLR
jgi:methionyl-tRNA synthetase